MRFFASGFFHDTNGNLPPASLTPVANLAPTAHSNVPTRWETFPGDCNHGVHKMTHSAKSERFGLYGCSILPPCHWCQVWTISAKQLFNTVNGELVSCLGRKYRASQLNPRHSDVYCSAGIFFRWWQPWRSQDHTLGRVRKIWALWLILK
jgi:hypothetical protein